MSVAGITLRWEWMRTALFMSRHCGIPTGPAELASWVSSVEGKTWCTKKCHKYSLWRCMVCSTIWPHAFISYCPLNWRFSLNTSCNIPIYLQMLLQVCLLWTPTLSWLLKKRLFFHYLLIAGFWLRCISLDSVEILLLVQLTFLCTFRGTAGVALFHFALFSAALR